MKDKALSSDHEEWYQSDHPGPTLDCGREDRRIGGREHCIQNCKSSDTMLHSIINNWTEVSQNASR